MSKSERFKKIFKKVLTSCLEKIKIRTIREVVNEIVFSELMVGGNKQQSLRNWTNDLKNFLLYDTVESL